MKLFIFSLFENALSTDENPDLFMNNPTKYQFYIPFINGIFDALPPNAILIEGFGSTGYRINKPSAYLELRYSFQNRVLKLLDEKHKNKFLTQVQMAPGTYLDAYFFKSFWYDSISKNNKNRVDLLQRNLAASLAFSDEYSWTWGECGNWWPYQYTGARKWMGQRREKVGGGLWENVASGVTQAVAKTKDTIVAAEDFIRRRKPINLLKNGDFEAKEIKEGSIPAWSIWKSDGSVKVCPQKGRNNTKGLVISGNTKGLCVGNYYKKVKAGQRYIVIGYAKANKDKQFFYLRLDWGSDGKHDGIHMEKKFSFGKVGKDSFQRLIAVVDVPYGVDYLRPTPFVGPLAKDAEIVFDDFELYLWE